MKELLGAARRLEAIGLDRRRLGREAWRLSVWDEARRVVPMVLASRPQGAFVLTMDRLKLIQERNRKHATAGELSRARALGDIEDVACGICEGTRFVGVRMAEGRPAVPVPCDCMPLVERAEFAGIDRRYLHATIENFRPAPGKNIAKAFAESWDGHESVVFWGDVGRGKTHLGCALLNKNLAKSRPAKFISVAQMMDELKARFDDDAKEQSQAYFDRIAREPVLMLDDLGKEQDTAWTRERMSTLLDRRYRTEATTILTTNLTHELIAYRYGAHLADRLYEWKWVEVGGVSVRREGAA